MGYNTILTHFSIYFHKESTHVHVKADRKDTWSSNKTHFTNNGRSWFFVLFKVVLEICAKNWVASFFNTAHQKMCFTLRPIFPCFFLLIRFVIFLLGRCVGKIVFWTNETDTQNICTWLNLSFVLYNKLFESNKGAY